MEKRKPKQLLKIKVTEKLRRLKVVNKFFIYWNLNFTNILQQNSNLIGEAKLLETNVSQKHSALKLYKYKTIPAKQGFAFENNKDKSKSIMSKIMLFLRIFCV